MVHRWRWASRWPIPDTSRAPVGRRPARLSPPPCSPSDLHQSAPAIPPALRRRHQVSLIHIRQLFSSFSDLSRVLMFAVYKHQYYRAKLAEKLLLSCSFLFPPLRRSRPSVELFTHALSCHLSSLPATPPATRLHP